MHCAAASQTPISAAQHAARIEVVANCRRRNPRLTHRMADLVEAEHHITRSIKSCNGGALVRVDLDRPAGSHRCTQRDCKIAVHDRSQRWIDRLERRPRRRCGQQETMQFDSIADDRATNTRKVNRAR